MAQFSLISFQKLSTSHIDLQTLFNEIIKNMDCTIVCGYRDQQDQDAAFASGKSKLKYPNSKHNHSPSWAIDAVPFIQGRVDWAKDQVVFFAGYVFATAHKLFRDGKITHRLRLGADFNENGIIGDDSFIDLDHFELILNPGETL